MRRACVDIASNWFKHPLTAWVSTPDEARDHFAGTRFRFDVATVFSGIDRFKDFTNYMRLFECLLEADEIISFNGRICDLIVLESLIGREPMQEVWRKPHHDLLGWRGHSLLRAVRAGCPEIADTFEHVRLDRRAELEASCDENLANALAGTYRDARFTFALFERYIASGDSDHTFRDTP